MKRPRSILLIDDNEDDNFIHSRAIREFGFTGELLHAYDGVEALALLRRNESRGSQQGALDLDLIFLDINMPRMDGWEFLAAYERLSGIEKGTVIVVMLSNSDNPDDREKANHSDQIVRFMNKPLTIDKLRRIEEDYFLTGK